MKDMIISWALDRLNERNTWIGLMTATATKLGLHFAPDFDNLVVNLCLSLMVVVTYAVKGKPIITGGKK